MEDIWTSSRKSPGVTNGINDGSITLKQPWNWQIIESLLVLLTTPVLFLLHHIKMSAVLKGLFHLHTLHSENNIKRKVNCYFLTQHILALGLEKGEFGYVDIHFQRRQFWNEDICI